MSFPSPPAFTEALPVPPASSPARRWIRPAAAVAGVAASVLVAWLAVDSPIIARSIVIAGVCLTLWLTELVPPFVPTLLLLGAQVISEYERIDRNA